jgi:hypothetical protein
MQDPDDYNDMVELLDYLEGDLTRDEGLRAEYEAEHEDF